MHEVDHSIADDRSLAVGIEPTSFNCKASALTNGLLIVPDIPLLKDHVQTEM